MNLGLELTWPHIDELIVMIQGAPVSGSVDAYPLEHSVVVLPRHQPLRSVIPAQANMFHYHDMAVRMFGPPAQPENFSVP